MNRALALVLIVGVTIAAVLVPALLLRGSDSTDVDLWTSGDVTAPSGGGGGSGPIVTGDPLTNPNGTTPPPAPPPGSDVAGTLSITGRVTFTDGTSELLTQQGLLAIQRISGKVVASLGYKIEYEARISTLITSSTQLWLAAGDYYSGALKAWTIYGLGTELTVGAGEIRTIFDKTIPREQLFPSLPYGLYTVYWRLILWFTASTDVGNRIPKMTEIYYPTVTMSIEQEGGGGGGGGGKAYPLVIAGLDRRIWVGKNY